MKALAELTKMFDRAKTPEDFRDLQFAVAQRIQEKLKEATPNKVPTDGGRSAKLLRASLPKQVLTIEDPDLIAWELRKSQRIQEKLKEATPDKVPRFIAGKPNQVTVVRGPTGFDPPQVMTLQQAYGADVAPLDSPPTLSQTLNEFLSGSSLETMVREIVRDEIRLATIATIREAVKLELGAAKATGEAAAQVAADLTEMGYDDGKK